MDQGTGAGGCLDLECILNIDQWCKIVGWC